MARAMILEAFAWFTVLFVANLFLVLAEAVKAGKVSTVIMAPQNFTALGNFK